MSKEFRFLVYRSAEEDASVNAVIKDETIWLTQKSIAELFGVQTPAINKHLLNIYDEGELVREATISKMEIVQTELERTVSGYFDYVEDLIERENVFTMEDFTGSINKFLSFREYKILPDKGSVSRKIAASKAEKEYTEFNKIQKITSDFDRQVRRLLEEGGKADE